MGVITRRRIKENLAKVKNSKKLLKIILVLMQTMVYIVLDTLILQNFTEL